MPGAPQQKQTIDKIDTLNARGKCREDTAARVKITDHRKRLKRDKAREFHHSLVRILLAAAEQVCAKSLRRNVRAMHRKVTGRYAVKATIRVNMPTVV